MAIIRNENIDLRVGKPIRNTDTVGVNKNYTSKENIPMTYRYEYMSTIDDSGQEWRLEGGIADINWTKTGGDLTTHVDDLTNPHEVTYTQVGAEPSDWDIEDDTRFGYIHHKPLEFPPEAHTQDWSTLTGIRNNITLSGFNDDLDYYTQGEVDDKVAQAASGLKYSWDTTVEMLAQTGMLLDDQGINNEDRWVYKYDGAVWVQFYRLDGTHDHDGIYYRQTYLDTTFSGKSDIGHVHVKADITDFTHTHVKADITDFAHTHTIGDVDLLQDALDTKVESIVEGTNISIDNTDPLNPIISADAQPQENTDWNSVSGVSELLNKPNIPDAQVNSDWNSTSGVSEVLNKPTAFPPETHSHPISEVTNLQTNLNEKELLLGNPDSDGEILSSTISGDRTWITPSTAALPTGGNTGEVLIKQDNGNVIWHKKLTPLNPIFSLADLNNR